MGMGAICGYIGWPIGIGEAYDGIIDIGSSKEIKADREAGTSSPRGVITLGLMISSGLSSSFYYSAGSGSACLAFGCNA